MMMRDFDCFVGIDWSGARGPYQAGLAVFLAEAGHSRQCGYPRQTRNAGAATPSQTGFLICLAAARSGRY